MAAAVKAVPVERFGKDHWSLLAYLETLAVDRQPIDRDRMRTDGTRHPLLMGPRVAMVYRSDRKEYPTRLKDGVEKSNHDDWDCLDDLEAAGYVEILSLVNGRFAMTKLGLAVAALLRQHKAAGGMFATFEPREVVGA